MFELFQRQEPYLRFELLSLSEDLLYLGYPLLLNSLYGSAKVSEKWLEPAGQRETTHETIGSIR